MAHSMMIRALVAMVIMLTSSAASGLPKNVINDNNNKIPLKVSGGIRMDLTMRNLSSSCSEHLLQSSRSCSAAGGGGGGDPLTERLSCMSKKSTLRANKMLSAVRSRGGDVVRESEVLAEVVSGSPSVRTDYESPVASGGGDYVTTVSIGTPAKTYSVIADTGSDLIWVQCEPCDQCFDQDEPIFDPKESSSYSPRSCSDSMCQALPTRACSPSECQYVYGYGDGSGTRGTLSSETVTLTTTAGDSVKVKSLAFGCGHRNKGTFSDSAGLMGLGRGPLSFISQLGTLFENKFSYCLVPWTDAPSKTSPMFFGEAAISEAAEVASDIKYTPMIRNQAMDTFYYVQLKDISVGGRRLGIPDGTFDIKPDGSGGLIFDSGTTLTLLQDDAYQKVLTSLKSKVSLPRVDGSSAGLDLCYDISRARSSYKSKFPAMAFHFANADYPLPLENYFIAANKAGTVLCLAMASSNMDIGIFGNMQQQNFHIVYDIENTRIGWAPAKCEAATAS